MPLAQWRTNTHSVTDSFLIVLLASYRNRATRDGMTWASMSKGLGNRKFSAVPALARLNAKTTRPQRKRVSCVFCRLRVLSGRHVSIAFLAMHAHDGQRKVADSTGLSTSLTAHNLSSWTQSDHGPIDTYQCIGIEISRDST